MLRFLSVMLLTALAAAVLTWFFPWWTIAIACAASGLLSGQRPARAFLCGFLSIALLWGVYGWYLSAANDYLLVGKMAQLFHLPQAWMYLALSALLGGITGGMAALSGALLSTRRHRIRG